MDFGPGEMSTLLLKRAMTGARIRIYTRTGDKGTTSLYSGERRPKDDAIFESLGTNDELSSMIGLAISYGNEKTESLMGKLEKIQCCLQDASSNIATPKSNSPEMKISTRGANFIRQSLVRCGWQLVQRVGRLDRRNGSYLASAEKFHPSSNFKI